ncbi:MAG: NADH-quinone oxidoreductase subunit J [Gemmatimonadales bacterium]|nr:NADH-quinone oxidoreductase subunit J [Gemmatimonadales bacterium]
MTEAVFYIFGASAVVTAALAVLSRNPMAAVLWLVGTMLSLAGIYVLLNAEFVAAIQVLVYAGAVMVLFLFVIMLLNLGSAKSDLRGPPTIAAAVVIVGLLLVELVALWSYSPERLAAEVAQAPAMADPASVFMAGELARQETQARGVIGGVAAPLFQTYLVPFEITSILLLAAIVGAVVLAKRGI